MKYGYNGVIHCHLSFEFPVQYVFSTMRKSFIKTAFCYSYLFMYLFSQLTYTKAPQLGLHLTIELEEDEEE